MEDEMMSKTILDDNGKVDNDTLSPLRQQPSAPPLELCYEDIPEEECSSKLLAIAL